jgi:hemolysin D
MRWRLTLPVPLKERAELFQTMLKRYQQVFRLAWAARDELAGPKRLATERAFLPAALSLQESPPHPAPRRAIAVICIAFLAAILWASFGKLDVVAVAPGRIIVSERSKVIQPLEAATVRAIHVKDGQQVQEGELLIELDSTQVWAEHTQNKQQWLAALSEKLRAHALQVGMTSAKRALLPPTEATPWCGLITPERCEPWLTLHHQLDTEWQDMSSKRERLAATVETREGQIQVAQASIKRLHDLQDNLRKREYDYSALASQGFISQHGLQDKTRDRLDIDNELARVRAEHKTATAAHQEAIKEQNAYLAEIQKNLSQRSFTAQQDIDRLTQDLFI